MKKRILTAFLAVVMLLTFIPVMASAAGTLTVTAGTVEVEEGATTVSVPVYLSNNPGICTLKVVASYDTEALTLSSISKGDLSTDMTNNKNTGTMLLSASENVEGDGLFATLNFTIKEGASSGSYAITLSNGSWVDFDEVSGTAALVNGAVVIPEEEVAGEFTVTAATVEVEEGATTVSVPVTLSNNPGICTLKVVASYDTAALTLSSISKGDLSTDMTNNKNTGTMLLSASENVEGDGLFATLNFTINEGASGSYAITLSNGSWVDFDEVSGTAALVNGAVVVPAPAGPTYTETKLVYADDTLTLQVANTATFTAAKVVVVTYSDTDCKRFLDVDFVNVTCAADSAQTVPYTVDAGAKTKAMLWLDNVNCQPLADAINW